MSALGDAYKRDEFLGKPNEDSDAFKSVKGEDPEGHLPGVLVTSGRAW